MALKCFKPNILNIYILNKCKKLYFGSDLKVKKNNKNLIKKRECMNEQLELAIATVYVQKRIDEF